MNIAKQHQLTRCHACSKVLTLPSTEQHLSCPRCGSHVSYRNNASISKTWALLITAVITLVMANLYPVMTVISFGHGHPDTIISGIILLIEEKMYPIAFLVFFASVLVPIFKIIGLMFLLIAIQRRWEINHQQALKLYKVIHFIGRWSMLDLFMISILVALVNLGEVATIYAGMGATAFATVVVVTMLAAHTFDQRLIWDLVEQPQPASNGATS